MQQLQDLSTNYQSVIHRHQHGYVQMGRDLLPLEILCEEIQKSQEMGEVSNLKFPSDHLLQLLLD